MAYDRKNLKGYGHSGKDDAAFLKVDNERGNWVAGASGHGANAKFDDDYGYRRGQALIRMRAATERFTTSSPMKPKRAFARLAA